MANAVGRAAPLELVCEMRISGSPSIGTAFLAGADGRLIDIVPPTPAIVGRDFRFRDW